MIVKKYKVKYMCALPSCGQIVSVSTTICRSKDVTTVGYGFEKTKRCYTCKSAMAIVNVECLVSTDMFGTDVIGTWVCDTHPYNPFYTIPLRKAYYKGTINSHLLPLYKEIVESGFPWRCPTCKEPLKYEERTGSTRVG